MRRKCYATFEELWVWASMVKNPDFKDTAKEEIEHVFDPVAAIFDGSQTYIDPSSGELKKYPKIMDNYAEIFNHYIEQYGERLCARPVEIGRFNPQSQKIMDYDRAMYVVLNILRRSIKHFTQINELKYLNLLQTLNYDYNPIENYSMEEDGTDDHDTKANQLGGLEVNGPLSNVTLGTNPDGTPSISIEFDQNRKLQTKVNQVQDTRQGQQAGTVTDSSVNTVAGTPIRTDHYTTTYDDASNSRLESYDTASGSSANVALGISQTDAPVTGKAYSGAPNHPSYKDTHHFTRTGNIGTVTAQDMIEQEREKARINIFNEFCEELNKYIFLSTWN